MVLIPGDGLYAIDIGEDTPNLEHLREVLLFFCSIEQQIAVPVGDCQHQPLLPNPELDVHNTLLRLDDRVLEYPLAVDSDFTAALAVRLVRHRASLLVDLDALIVRACSYD